MSHRICESTVGGESCCKGVDDGDGVPFRPLLAVAGEASSTVRSRFRSSRRQTPHFTLLGGLMKVQCGQAIVFIAAVYKDTPRVCRFEDSREEERVQ